MNKNQNTSNNAPAQGKTVLNLFWLLRKCAPFKPSSVFDFSLNQEKLPIIYANIRV